MSLSQAIVQFIDHLHPLYMHETVNGVMCARSLADGTLIFPVEEDEDVDSGFVMVHWQGDPSRQSLLHGVYLASLAVARYVELRHVAEGDKATRREMEHISNHFTVKTGESLVFEGPDSNLLEAVMKAVDRVGQVAVIEILKKTVGL